ncbi:recombination protein O N-terminal domain-containing protein [Devosia sp. A8/3-2]|nr:recombination protein O N-terminal domain-containing protein [Devosia sp. A8/3-2]
MEWTGEALLIGVRRHGESSVIAEAMVAGRGRHMGLVRGGRSRRLSAVLQPGNTIQLTGAPASKTSSASSPSNCYKPAPPSSLMTAPVSTPAS